MPLPLVRFHSLILVLICLNTEIPVLLHVYVVGIGGPIHNDIRITAKIVHYRSLLHLMSNDTKDRKEHLLLV